MTSKFYITHSKREPKLWRLMCIYKGKHYFFLYDDSYKYLKEQKEYYDAYEDRANKYWCLLDENFQIAHRDISLGELDDA